MFCVFLGVVGFKFVLVQGAARLLVLWPIEIRIEPHTIPAAGIMNYFIPIFIEISDWQVKSEVVGLFKW